MNRHCAPCVLARSSALAVQLATICSDFQMAAFVTVDWSMRGSHKAHEVPSSGWSREQLPFVGGNLAGGPGIVGRWAANRARGSSAAADEVEGRPGPVRPLTCHLRSRNGRNRGVRAA
jgi:hypothetical protein